MECEVIYMEVRPKTLTSKMGSHTLLLRYDPNETITLRWSWLLRVTTLHEYTGKCESPGECRVEAARFSAFHDMLEGKK